MEIVVNGRAYSMDPNDSNGVYLLWSMVMQVVALYPSLSADQIGSLMAERFGDSSAFYLAMVSAFFEWNAQQVQLPEPFSLEFLRQHGFPF
ncbi:hypothetical protein [Tengunoibacter tsumagoiensis]|uniref:Uncharacterized protein n=1 Tax=Tengunoibacter tsumagoiensis TaxID=2014871 RepID=A0A401ZZ51_9CHLR|nr:hypothetical protein [Tengunoibacter tsumagoiensis]GCE12117.1 hypothetical protein KTT_19760 [Tengunoibacter tsumagoiensis]